MTEYVYHRAVENMQGTILYPLNQLKGVFPTAYAEHVKKYEGREQLLEAKIPTLDCLWNDAIHLTAVTPPELYKNLKTAGINSDKIVWKKWFKIPIDILEPEKTTTCLYRRDIGLVSKLRDFQPFDPSKMDEYRKVPPETILYYKEQAAIGKRPLLFHLVPHILYKGTLETKGFEIVSM